METDAKIYAMVHDMSDGALEILLEDAGLPVPEGDLRQHVIDAYERGQIDGHEIVAAWNDDTAEAYD